MHGLMHKAIDVHRCFVFRQTWTV